MTETTSNYTSDPTDVFAAFGAPAVLRSYYVGFDGCVMVWRPESRATCEGTDCGFGTHEHYTPSGYTSDHGLSKELVARLCERAGR